MKHRNNQRSERERRFVEDGHLPALVAQLAWRRRTDRCSGLVVLHLAREMRRRGVTIRGLAADMGITMKRVRQVRDTSPLPYLVALDYAEALLRIAGNRTVSQ